MMKATVLGALGSALLAAGCAEESKKTVGEGLPYCQGTQRDDVSLAANIDGFEIRELCANVDTDAGPYASATAYGDSCSQTTCADAIAQLDDNYAPSDDDVYTGFDNCTRYIVTMQGGEVLQSGGSLPLATLIGTVDTVGEAELAARLGGLSCARIGRDGDGSSFLVVDVQILQDCPIKQQEVLYRIDYRGHITEVDRGDVTEPGACIGRRPVGLVPRGRCDTSLGDHLARAAELEAASVIAFGFLKRDLAAHGAPVQLLTRIDAAARDEVRHARTVATLARRFQGHVTPRHIRVPNIASLEAVASENAREGCVNETWGALIGLHQARRATDPELRRAYRTIAADEARHAQLSWDIAHWATQRLSRSAVRRVQEQRDQAVAQLAQSLTAEELPPKARRLLGLPKRQTRRACFQHLTKSLWG
jgi:hypothetical protein